MSNEMIQRIINLREKHNISQVELAKKLNIEKSAMNKIESGNRKIQTNEIIKLSQIFNVSTDYLLYGNNSVNIPSWATESEIIELEKLLNEEVALSFGGVELTEEEQQRVKDIITTIFWEKIKEDRKDSKD